MDDVLKEIIEDYRGKSLVESVYGVALTDLSREDLMALVAWLKEEREALEEKVHILRMDAVDPNWPDN